MQLVRVKLSRRGKPPPRDAKPLTSPSDVSDFVRRRIGRDASEHLLVILLDSHCVPLGFLEYGTGHADRCRIAPAEVARAVLLANATAVILAHNHPSGSRVFSDDDETFTRSLARALALFDVEVYDHVLVTPKGKYSTGYDSMRARGMLAGSLAAEPRFGRP